MSGARHRTCLGESGARALETAGDDRRTAGRLDLDARARVDCRESGATAVDLRSAEAADPGRADLRRVHEEVDALACEPADVLDFDLELALALVLELRFAAGARKGARGLQGDPRSGAALRLHGGDGDRQGREGENCEWDERALHGASLNLMLEG